MAQTTDRHSRGTWATSIRSARNLRNALIDCAGKEGIERIFAALRPAELDLLLHDWAVWARADQLPPPGDWTSWLILGGRGAGKTRSGAEWIRGVVSGTAPYPKLETGRVALIGETHADAREIMVEGISGLLAVHPARERPRWEISRRRLLWSNGAIAQIYSAEDPESLRGPQFEAAWSDEIGKWNHAEETWDMLQFALRLGTRPRQVATTTPRPTPLIKRLIDDPQTVVTRVRTMSNAANLAPGFLDAIVGRYAGTRLGRQELDGELIEDRQDALWHRPMIEQARVPRTPSLRRIVVAVDPPASHRRGADACGIVAAGLCADGIAYVIADESIAGARPAEWANRAVILYHRLGADALIAEVNQGGDMVAAVINEIDVGVPVTAVRASRGKWLRAEPVAALYEQGRVRHAGTFPELEDEMCDFGPDGLSNGRSPDRLDALVWALTALLLRPPARPNLRFL